MGALHTLGVAEGVALVRQGDVSPVAMAEACLKRIEALEPALQAWVTIDRDGALAAARRCEQQMQQGENPGLLAGVPVGLKDIFYTAGLLTTAGSKVYADFVPDYDATSVTRLRQNGVAIIGKAVTTEFATSDPAPSRNPWNAAHTPGGSSSGSAVAVAARMVPAALGSQTGGSMLRPAAYNGIVGLKPTYGRISRYGVIPVSWCLDHVGILVWCAVWKMPPWCCRLSPDPTRVTPVPWPSPWGLISRRFSKPIRPLALGFCTATFQIMPMPRPASIPGRRRRSWPRPEPPCKASALPPSFGTVLAAQRIIMKVEMAAFHADMFMTQRDQYRPKIRESIESGLFIPGVEYLRAQRLRRLFQDKVSQMFQDVDVLSTPATPAPAPRDLSTTGDASFQAPWTYAGVSAMALPSGLSGAGMPMGIQLIAPHAQEDRLLRAARWCEAALDVSLAPPV